MTDDTMALRGLLEKSADASFLHEMIGFAAERLMEFGSGRADRRNAWRTQLGQTPSWGPDRRVRLRLDVAGVGDRSATPLKLSLTYFGEGSPVRCRTSSCVPPSYRAELPPCSRTSTVSSQTRPAVCSATKRAT